MAKLLLPPLTLAALSGAAMGQFTPAEQKLINQIRPSLATLADAGRFLGSAVLIGEDGRFIAHNSALRGIGRDGIIATLSDGTKVRLFIETRDLPSKYVLLQARPWTSTIKPVKALADTPAPGTGLVALLGENSFRVQVSARERIGIDGPSKRMIPLSELAFENTYNRVAGSALFTPKGEFAGFVIAVLTPEQKIAEGIPNFGPTSLIVAYSVSPDITRRSVEGYLSDSRRPLIATVGVVCRDAPKEKDKSGALVIAVEATGPAGKAGLLVNDVIIEIAGRPIKDQVAFAKALYALRPGDTAEFRIRRADKELLLNIPLVLAPAPQGPGK